MAGRNYRGHAAQRRDAGHDRDEEVWTAHAARAPCSPSSGHRAAAGRAWWLADNLQDDLAARVTAAGQRVRLCRFRQGQNGGHHRLYRARVD